MLDLVYAEKLVQTRTHSIYIHINIMGVFKMNINNMYIKIQKIIDYIDEELNKPYLYHNYETRIWQAGYRRAMKSVKEFILNVLNKNN